MSSKYLILVSVASLWVAVVAMATMLFRSVGPITLKRHWISTAVIVLAVAWLPAAAAWHVTVPYAERIFSRLNMRAAPDLKAVAGCSVFPADNVWNVPIAALPTDPKSDAYIRTIGADVPLHADFSMPYNVIYDHAPVSTVSFGEGAAESDPGPYRIPDNSVVEAGSDGHVLVADMADCQLYELYLGRQTGSRQWEASSGAIFDLRGNGLRPNGWTSADAAGLPLLPGLVRYDEVTSGRIRHALRFTAPMTRADFVWPARHRASRRTDPDLPPMGQRFRLKAGFDVSSFRPDTQVILTALKEYGMMLADNGSPWFVTGGLDPRWSRGILSDLRRVVGADFEAVDVSRLMVDPNSGQTKSR